MSKEQFFQSYYKVNKNRIAGRQRAAAKAFKAEHNCHAPDSVIVSIKKHPLFEELVGLTKQVIANCTDQEAEELVTKVFIKLLNY